MSQTWNKTWDKDTSKSYTNLDGYFGDNNVGSQTADILSGMDVGADFYEGMGDNLPEGYSYVSPELVTIWKNKDSNGNVKPGKSTVQVKRPMGTWLNGDSIPVRTSDSVDYIMNVDVYEEVNGAHSITLTTDEKGNVTGYTLDGKTHKNNDRNPGGTVITTSDGTSLQIVEDKNGYSIKSLNNDNVVVTLDKNGKKTSYKTTGAVSEMDKQNVQNLLNISDGSWKTPGVWQTGASADGYTNMTEEEVAQWNAENNVGKKGGKTGTTGTGGAGGTVGSGVANLNILGQDTVAVLQNLYSQFSDGSSANPTTANTFTQAVANTTSKGKVQKAEGIIKNQAAVSGISSDGKMYNLKGDAIKGSEKWSAEKKNAYNAYTQYKGTGENDQSKISTLQADFLESGGKLKDKNGNQITTYTTALKNANSKNDTTLANNITQNQQAVTSNKGSLVNLSGKTIKGSENWSQKQKQAYNEYYQYKKSGGKDQNIIDKLQSNYINSGGTLKDSKGNVITAKYDSKGNKVGGTTTTTAKKTGTTAKTTTSSGTRTSGTTTSSRTSSSSSGKTSGSSTSSRTSSSSSGKTSGSSTSSRTSSSSSGKKSGSTKKK